MPVEIRKIIFSKAEMIDAFERFAKDVKHAMPPGKMVACHVDGADDLSVSLTVQNLADGVSSTTHFDQAAVAAVLIHYCMKKKIPLAKAAGKSVQAEGTDVTLTLRLPEH